MAVGRGGADRRIRLGELGLQALTAFAVFEAVRILFPLLFAVRESSGSGLAVGIAFLAFLAPSLAGPLHRVAGNHAALLLAVAVLAAGRLGFTFVRPIPVWLAAVTTAAGLIALTLELRAARATPESSSAFAIGVLVGLSADTVVRGAFLSWDAAWRTGLVPTVVTLAIAAGLVAFAMVDRGEADEEPSFRYALPAALLGPFLMLQLQFVQNPAFVASGTGLALPAASALVLLGDALGIAAVIWIGTGRVSAAPRVLAAAIALGGTVTLATANGALVAVALPVTQMAAVGLLAAGLAHWLEIPTYATAWRTGLASTLGMVAFVALAFAYQIHIDVPLPVPRPAWPVLAAAALALAGARSRRVEPTPRWRALWVLPLAGLALPLTLSVTAPALCEAPGDGSPVRVLDWNLHGAVDGEGQVDPEAIARLIETQAPDVVVLQEVARGWPITGTVDMAEWLSRRLQMPYAWAPAADDQFGNVVMSRFRIEEAEVIALPYGEGPQHRSALRVVLDAGFAEPFTVIATHLQNGEHPSTNGAQIEVLLDTWGGGATTIIAGDMNVQPTQENAALFTDAGLVSAQDVTGHGSSSTARDPNFPGDRVDWIFGSSDLVFSEFSILESEASDHLPVLVTVAPA